MAGGTTAPNLAAGAPAGKRSWIPHLIVVAVALGVYSNTLANDWVLDDFPQILDNPWIKSVRHLKDIFTQNAWAFDARDSSYYRPMIQVIYMLTYYIFGLRPWAFHLVNMLFHAGVCLLVFLTVSRLLRESIDARAGVFPALVGAILFAVHPIHTEVVAPVMGMHDLSFSFFYLLSFYLYIREDSRSRPAYVASVASFFVALLCKEPAVTLPAMLVAYDAVVRKDRIFIPSTLRRYAAYVAVIAIYLVMRFHSLGGVVLNQYSAAEMGAYGYVINVFPLFARYLAKLLVPVDLNLVYVYHPVQSIMESKAILSLVVTAAFALISWTAARRSKAAFLGCLFIVLPLLPALYLPGLNQKIALAFAERYLYLPSAGYALLASCIIAFALTTGRGLQVISASVMGALVLLFGLGTVSRNPDWKNSYTLWSDAVRKSPDSAGVHRDLGYAILYYKKDPEAAQKHFAIAVRLDPELSDGEIRAGIAHAQMGQIDRAILNFHAALLLSPDSTEAHYNLGLAYEEKDWQSQAISEYEAALRLEPRNADAHNNLGIAYARQRRTEKAMEHFKAAVGLRPEDAEFQANLARGYEQLGGGNDARK